MAWFGAQTTTYSSLDDGSSRPLMYWSIFAWFCFSLLGFLLCTDFSISPSYTIEPFANWYSTREALFSGAILLVSSSLAGAAVALPAMLVYHLTRPRMETLYKRSWNFPAIRISILRYFPVAVLIASQFAALSLSIGSAPGYAREADARPGFLASWSRFVNDHVFPTHTDDSELERWQNLMEKGKTHALVILFPSSVLSTPDLFPKLKRALGDPSRIFLDAPTFPASLQQLLHGYTGFQPRYFTPYLSPATIDPGELAMDGNDAFSDLPVDASLAPEYRMLELEIKEKTTVGNAKNFSVAAVLRKRMAMAQPHLFFMFRLGWIGKFIPAWDWKDLVNDDAYRLHRFLKQSEKDDAAASVKVIQLSELENRRPEITHPLSGINWKEPPSLTERQLLLARVDAMLAQAAQAVRKHGQTSLLVLPYPDGVKSVPLTWDIFCPLRKNHPHCFWPTSPHG